MICIVKEVLISEDLEWFKMNKKLLLIGGDGHCKSVIEAILLSGEYNEIGIIDQPQKVGSEVLGVKIIGNDSDLPDLKEKGFEYAFISLGSIGNPKRRVELFKILFQLSFRMPIIVHPSANISYYCEIEEGIFIGKNVTVNGDAKVLKNSILNTGCIIEHDCQIGSFAHIAPGVVLSGNVRIGNNTHIGAATVIRQDISIGDNAVIGIGSVVTKEIGDNCLAYGNPCRIKK
ncbi:acetyltransferase [Acetobacterium malicum]|uniref:acetyltransferase n=1 Tax=Acetobacterium malicum TaxID=52692 RepID=UPI0003F59078|nr:acetyltransferase [Acetobacterium dehalogenans]